MKIKDILGLDVGCSVENIDVQVAKAGKTAQVDKALSPKQSKQEWEQRLGLADSSGEIGGIYLSSSYKPIHKGSEMKITKAAVGEVPNKANNITKVLMFSEYTQESVTEPPEEKSELDPMVEKILEKYDIAATDALWPCKKYNKKTGKTTTRWIIYHKYCEQIAVKAHIVFDKPVLASNGDHGTVAMLVVGHLGHAEEWSYGEAGPETTYIKYHYAMAEKRAKDRVILKLVGLHAFVYSEEEADWEKENGS